MKNCWLRLPVLCCTYGRNLDPTSLHTSSIKIVLSSSTHRNRHPDGYTQIDQQTSKNSSYIFYRYPCTKRYCPKPAYHLHPMTIYTTLLSFRKIYSSNPYIYTRIVIMPGIIHPFVKESIFLEPYCMHETLERVPIRPTSPITARLALPTAT